MGSGTALSVLTPSSRASRSLRALSLQWSASPWGAIAKEAKEKGRKGGGDRQKSPKINEAELVEVSLLSKASSGICTVISWSETFASTGYFGKYSTM